METLLLEGDKLLFAPNTNVYTQLIKFQNNPPHRHDFIEFTYLVSGNVTHIINGETIRLNPRDAVLLVYKDEHHYQEPDEKFMHRDVAIRDSFFREVCDFFSPGLYQKIVDKEFSLAFPVGGEEIAKLEALTSQFELQNDVDKDMVQKQICAEIVGLILMHNGDHADRTNWVSRLIIFLSSPQYIGDSLSDILEQYFPYSREYMCRIFKERTGMTMTEYFNMNKMKYADTLIKSGNYTNEEVQEIVNIKNTSYFYRLYKKTFGVSSRKNKKNK